MKWCILLNLFSYLIKKQSQIIVIAVALHNFIKDSAIYDADFENYDDDDAIAQGTQDTTDDTSAGIDESDMGAFCDSIAAALLS